MIRRRTLGRFFIVGVALLALSGCSVEPGFAAREWGKAVRHYNMIPVFPLREDIQVGDVYLLPASPDEMDRQVVKGKDFLAISTLHDSLNLMPELRKFQRTRLQLPRISATTDLSDGTDGSLVSVADKCQGNAGDCDLFNGTPAKVTSLRQVALPDVHLATFTGAEARAIVPTAAFAASGGAVYQSVESATLKVPAAESYGLPTSVVFSKLFPKESTRTKDDASVVACFDVASAVRLAKARVPEPKKVYFRIPTEIFIARAIDMDVKLSRSGGASLTVAQPMPDGRARQALDALLAVLSGKKPQDEGEGEGQGQDEGEGQGEGEGEGEGETGAKKENTGEGTPQAPRPDIPADVAVEAARIAGMLEVLESQGGGPGAGLKVIRASQGAVTLRRTFQRPLVIGVKAIDVAVPTDKSISVEQDDTCKSASGVKTSWGGAVIADVAGGQEPGGGVTPFNVNLGIPAPK